ncbi:MAG: helix-turn-helix domain-containing protein [Acidimicrobiia bacterium]|nr:MAG: helix-turn-helix domain-containing protein [Acidimicrobiia bacterium]
MGLKQCGFVSIGWYATDPGWWLRETSRPLTEVEQNAAIRFNTRRQGGRLDPSLPSPLERASIRSRAGYTQQDIARLLDVSRHTVTKWEQPAGYIDGRRLPGREPVGDLREQYASLLSRLEAAVAASQ